MLYVAVVWPGSSPVEAQIWTSSPGVPNLSHSSHEVRVEPGKNVCWE